MTRPLAAPPRGRIRRSAPERRTYRGVVYASLAEARYAAELDLLKRAGKLTHWEAQVPYGLRAWSGNNVLPEPVAKYVADFVLTFPGRKELHEVKARHGYRDPVWRLKLKWLKACYPELVVKVVER